MEAPEEEMRHDRRRQRRHSGYGSGREDSYDPGRERRMRSHSPLSARRRTDRLFYAASAVVLVLLLVAASFLLAGKMAGFRRGGVDVPGSPATPAPSAPARGDVMQERILIMADAALRAQAEGKFSEALASLGAIRDLDRSVAGVDLKMAEVAFASGDQLGAINHLERAARSPHPSIGHFVLRGRIDAQENNHLQADFSFRAATMADPFDPYAFYYWGEALRREGKLRQAIKQLDRALIRSGQPAESFVIRSKILLCRVEAGDATLLDEIEAELAKPEPAGEMLAAAGAWELKRGDFGTARDRLVKARAATGPVFHGLILADRFFDFYRTRPGLEDLLGQGRGG